MKHVTAVLPISFLSRTKSVRGGGGYSASLNRAVSRLIVCVTAMIAFAAVSVYGQMPPPTAEIIFPTKGQTDIARNFDIVIRIRGAIDTTKFYCKWSDEDSTHDDLYRPGILLMEKSNKDTLVASDWNQQAFPGKITRVNDSTLNFHTPFLKYNTTYTIVIDSLRKLTGGLYLRDTCNFTVTSPPHAVTSLSLESKNSLNCVDTIILTFNKSVDSLNTPSGNIVQMLRTDTTGSFNSSVTTTTWFDSTHKIVYIRPFNPYMLGEPYLLKINTHFLNGDTNSAILASFDVRKGFAVHSKPKILSLPGSPSEHDADSIANYQLADYMYPIAGGNSFLYGDTARIYAQRIVGQYRFVGFESTTDSAMFANIPTNSMDYTQVCSSSSHDLKFTAVYEIIPKQNFVFKADSNCSIKVSYNDSVYTSSDSVVLEMYVDSMDVASVWTIPNNGYIIAGWNSNVSPYDSMSSAFEIPILIHPEWEVGGWLHPVIAVSPTTGTYGFSASTVTEDASDIADADDVDYYPAKRVTTYPNPALRTITATAPDNYEWIDGGDITDGGKTISAERMTDDGDATVVFTMRRIRVSLRVEQRIITDATLETISGRTNVQWNGSVITVKESGKPPKIVTNQISPQWEDPSPGPKKKPYIVIKNLKCGKTTVEINNDPNEIEARSDKNSWDHYQEETDYTVPIPLNKKKWDVNIEEANALFTNTAVTPNQKEIRVRELFIFKFKLLQIGLAMMQKNGTNFEDRYVDFKKITKSTTGFPRTIGEDDGELDRGSIQYNSSGAVIKFVFNEELAPDVVPPFFVYSTGGINGGPIGYNSFYLPIPGYTLTYNGTYQDYDDQFLYTLTMTNEIAIPKMSELKLMMNMGSAKITSKTGAIFSDQYNEHLVDIEMPNVRLILEKIHYNFDGDEDTFGFYDYGQEYAYINGGVITVGGIDSKIYDDDLADGSVKLPVGTDSEGYKTTHDVNDKGGSVSENWDLMHEMASNTVRVRKTGVSFGFVSAWEEDGKNFFRVLSEIAGDIKGELDKLKAEASAKGTKVKIDGQEFDVSVIVSAVQTYFGSIQKILSKFSGQKHDFMGEQTFIGRRVNYFGKYDSKQIIKSDKNVEFFWNVILE